MGIDSIGVALIVWKKPGIIHPGGRARLPAFAGDVLTEVTGYGQVSP